MVGIESRENISRYLKDYDLFKSFVAKHRDLIGFVSSMYRRELGISNSTLIEIAIFDKDFWKRKDSSGIEEIINENSSDNNGEKDYTNSQTSGLYTNTLQSTKTPRPSMEDGGTGYIIVPTSLILVAVVVSAIVIYRRIHTRQ